MDIRVEIDPTRDEPRVIIQTAEKNEFIENLIYAIEQRVDREYPPLVAEVPGSVVMLNQWEVIRLHTENRKVKIHSESGVFESRNSLQEIETLLAPDRFVRISRFEIINLKKVSGFDFSMAGTIKVQFTDGLETWVARRYVSTIRDVLSRMQSAL